MALPLFQSRDEVGFVELVEQALCQCLIWFRRAVLAARRWIGERQFPTSRRRCFTELQGGAVVVPRGHAGSVVQGVGVWP